ncbi:MAG: hypoxanthine phosphoribosyltransferase [Deltaproteobacteria bacterium RIFOXYD12_FULL_57_12]|nr:MAG: hypoxanthine phosphoribosyltransferase [Deltaproteobacteria bacterium RIFOXYD12_FULL_57_12]
MPSRELILSKEEIAARVKELGAAISRDYADSCLILIGILNGAFVFLADLMRAIDLPVQVDFVRVASYGARSSGGEIRFVKDIELSIAGKDVLLVEDIVDTGRTIAHLRDILADHRPSSVRLCALIDKKERRQVAVTVDYVGFEVKQGFLVGYGLDFAEQHRHYPEIYHLRQE